MKSAKTRALALRSRDYDAMLDRVVRLIDEARRTSARSVNALMTATYWFIGRHIVEFEQQGKVRAEYGEELLKRMATDLATRFGKGYSLTNLKQFRQFYLAYPPLQKSQTPSDQLAVRDFSWNLAATSHLSGANAGFASATNGIASICCSFIAAFAVLSSLISSAASSRTLTPGRCTCI